MFVELATKLDMAMNTMLIGFDKLTAFLYFVFVLFVGGAVVWNIVKNARGTAILIVTIVILYFGYGFLTCPI